MIPSRCPSTATVSASPGHRVNRSERLAGFMGQGGPPPEQKADGGRATRLLDALGIEWQYDVCVFDVNNPHPEFAMLPPEYVFVTRSGEDSQAFNPDDPITRGLQELIALYPGEVDQRGGGDSEFEPLLKTGRQSGVLRWEEFVDEGGFNFFSMQVAANPRRNPFRAIDRATHTLAARVKRDSEDQQGQRNLRRRRRHDFGLLLSGTKSG